MKVVVTPESCKGEGAKYTGTVEMRPPFIEERWAYLDAVGLVDAGEEQAKMPSNLTFTKAIVKELLPKLKDHVSAMDLTHKESGQKLASLDELRADPDAQGVLLELGMMLIKGFRPGKP